jgi:hypothetical protein
MVQDGPGADPKKGLPLTKNDQTIGLDDKYTQRNGRVFISGFQALVLLPLLQRELDQRAGLDTAGFISGYRGSPIGRYDTALWQAQAHLDEHKIIFQPGVNEDLAATAVWGTQQLNMLPDPNVDGVFSIWYGKGPGVDRSGDAMKHGNYAGTHPNGGVLVVYGDDHPGKSSTLAHQSDLALAANSIPSLYPASVQEYIEFGLLGWALSRYAGLWVGFKTVNETIEQTATIEIAMDDFDATLPDRGDTPPDALHILDGEFPLPLKTEADIAQHRLPLVHQFVRANSIDKITINSPNRSLGIVTAGKAYHDVMQALHLLGIDRERAAAMGLSVYKVGCVWPLEPEGLKKFAGGQTELLFLEEKRPVVEDQAARILYGEPDRPRIVGKTDEEGHDLVSSVAMDRRHTADGPGGSHPVLLLRLPSQHLDPGAGRERRHGRHRLPRHGAHQPPGHLALYPYGWRGRPLDRPGTLHRHRARLPESGGRNLLSLGSPGDQGSGCRRFQHHLQNSLQRRRRDDRWPAGGRTHIGRQNQPSGNARRGQLLRGRDRRSGALWPRQRSRPGGGGLSP